MNEFILRVLLLVLGAALLFLIFPMWLFVCAKAISSGYHLGRRYADRQKPDLRHQ